MDLILPKLKSGLVTQAVEESLLVYNPEDHKAHSLNYELRWLFQSLAEERSLEDCLQEGKEIFCWSQPESMLSALLLRLRESGLTEQAFSLPRRRALKVLGVASVLTVFVPLAASAQSGLVTDDQCQTEAGNCGLQCDGIFERFCGPLGNPGDPFFDPRCACRTLAQLGVCGCDLS